MDNFKLESKIAIAPESIVVLEKSILSALANLQEFASAPDFAEKMSAVFGKESDVKDLQTAWNKGDFSVLPEIEIVSTQEINQANGAYSITNNKIYLAAEFINQNLENSTAITDLVLEEIGHSVDARLNNLDTPGDEGAYFVALVQGTELSVADIAKLKAENDLVTVNLNNQSLLLEQQIISGNEEDNILFGTNDDDELNGGIGNDTLNGVGSNKFNSGIGNKDILSGGEGSDLFILGTADHRYYDDLYVNSLGASDRAEITDFDLTQDKVQLQGTASDYRLERFNFHTHLYLNKPETDTDELIAVFKRTKGLNLNSDNFTYVSPVNAIAFQKNSYSTSEDNNAKITFNRTGDLLGEISVTLNLTEDTAKLREDFALTELLVSFAPGEKSKTIEVPLIDDLNIEDKEQLQLSLSNPSDGVVIGTEATATLDIIDSEVNNTMTIDSIEPIAINNEFLRVTGQGDNSSTIYNITQLPSNGNLALGATGISFNGEDDIVEIPHDDSLSLQTFTLETWINIEQTQNDWQPLIVKENQYGRERNYGLFLRPNETRPHFSFMDAKDRKYRAYNSPTHLELNKWYHLATTYDGSVFNLYIDGELDHSIDIVGLLVENKEPVKLGNEISRYAPFTGELDNVRIWNFARSEEDIQADLAKELTGNETGLVANWQFNESSETIAVDTTINGNDGTIRGAQPTHSIFEEQPQVLKVGDSFTQEDIDRGRVIFEPTNDTSFSDSLAFDVTDGINTVENRIFNITRDNSPGVINFSQLEYEIDENDRWNAVVKAQREGGSDGVVGATINLSAGTAVASDDYRNSEIKFTFADGEKGKILTIPILDDNIIEDIETLNLTLSKPTNGSTLGPRNSALVKIIDNDTLLDGFKIEKPLKDITVVENAENTVIDLSDLFRDINNENSIISKTITANSNKNLVTATIEGNNLLLDYEAEKSGKAEITIQGLSNDREISDTFTVNVTSVNSEILDVIAPKNAANTVIDLNNLFEEIDSKDGEIIKIVAGNSNQDLVTATIEDNNLILDYETEQSGTTEITIQGISRNKAVSDTFTVTVDADRESPILSLSDLVTLESNDANLALTLNNSQAVNKIEFELAYNSELLNINDIAPNENLPTTWELTNSEINSENGLVRVTLEGSDPLIGDNLNLADFAVTIPENLAYGSHQTIELQTVKLDGESLNVNPKHGTQFIAQLGDINLDNKIDGLDAYQISHIAVGLNPTVNNFGEVNPYALADINQDGVVSNFDSYLASID